MSAERRCRPHFIQLRIVCGDKPPSVVALARAMAEVGDLEKFKEAMDWTAIAWRMERRNPKAWGRKRVVAIHTGARRRQRTREEIEREMNDILGDHQALAGAGE